MRQTHLVLLALFAVMTGGVPAATPRHHLLAEFRLAPAVCSLAAATGTDSPLQLQILALNLKGSVYYQETIELKPVSPSTADGCVYRHRLLLEKGEYLLQFLFFHRTQDRFELIARNFSARGGGETTLVLPVNGLSGRDFNQHRRVLIYQESHPEKAFQDHMLWFRVKYLSRRKSEEWPDVFARLKVLCGDARLFLIERSGLSGSLAPDVYHDRLFEIAVRADSVRYLADQWKSGQVAGAEAEKDLLRSMDKEAKGIQAAGRSLSVPRRKMTRQAREDFETAFRGLPLPQQREAMLDLAGQLQVGVEKYFFSPHTTSVEDSIAGRDPLELAARVRTAAGLARKSLDSSRRGL
jgi:hypothetical protein